MSYSSSPWQLLYFSIRFSSAPPIAGQIYFSSHSACASLLQPLWSAYFQEYKRRSQEQVSDVINSREKRERKTISLWFPKAENLTCHRKHPENRLRFEIVLSKLNLAYIFYWPVLKLNSQLKLIEADSGSGSRLRSRGKGLAQWCEHSSPTNVSLVGLPDFQ